MSEEKGVKRRKQGGTQAIHSGNYPRAPPGFPPKIKMVEKEKGMDIKEEMTEPETTEQNNEKNDGNLSGDSVERCVVMTGQTNKLLQASKDAFKSIMQRKARTKASKDSPRRNRLEEEKTKKKGSEVAQEYDEEKRVVQRKCKKKVVEASRKGKKKVVEAPKKSKKSGSSSTVPKYDINKFRIPKRSIVAERPFQHLPDFPSFWEEIIRRKWEKLATPTRIKPSIKLVREVYSAMLSTRSSKVKIRGVWVDFSKEKINKYFDLPADPGYPEYILAQKGLMATDYDEVLARDGPKIDDWDFATYSQSTAMGEILDLSLSHFDELAWVWTHFVSANFLPSSHFTNILSDRLQLIYAILTEEDIDVGAVIHNAMWSHAYSGRCSLPFPIMIHDMCKTEGVEIVWNEPEGKTVGAFYYSRGTLATRANVPMNAPNVVANVTTAEGSHLVEPSVEAGNDVPPSKFCADQVPPSMQVYFDQILQNQDFLARQNRRLLRHWERYEANVQERWTNEHLDPYAAWSPFDYDALCPCPPPPSQPPTED